MRFQRKNLAVYAKTTYAVLMAKLEGLHQCSSITEA
jgi:hypothetical protein